MTLVAIPLFPRFAALDAVGPYEVLQRIPSIDVVFVGHRRGEVFTTSVCTGALLLAAAGLLDGLTATTHWRAADLLNELGALCARTSRRACVQRHRHGPAAG